MTPLKLQNELVSNVGVKQYIAFLKTGQKIKKAPGFVKKPGENLARSTKKDITGFSVKSAGDKALSDFFIFFLPSTILVGGLSFPFHCEPKKISSQLVKGDSAV